MSPLDYLDCLEFDGDGNVWMHGLPEQYRAGGVLQPDGATHFGKLPERITACAQRMTEVRFETLIRIECEGCVAEIKHRKENPEAAAKPFGELTYRPERRREPRSISGPSADSSKE